MAPFRVRPGLALVAVLALVAGACGGGVASPSAAAPTAGATSGPQATSQPTQVALSGKLTVWDWQCGSPSGTGLLKVDEEFKKLYPDIELDHVCQPVDGYIATWQGAYAARSGPDAIFNLAPKQIREYWSLLEPINDRITQEQRDNLIGWPAMTENGDQIFGLPYNVDGTGFFYNPAVFEAAGLDPDKPPSTVAELLAICAPIKEAGFTAFGGGGDGLSPYRGSLWGAFVNLQETRDVLSGAARWTDPKYRQNLQVIVDLYNSGCMEDDFLGTGWFDSGGPWSAGEVGVFPHYMGYVPKLNEGSARVFHVAADSSTPLKAINFGPSVAWSTTSWSEAKDLAWAYNSFVTSQQGQQIRFDENGIVPTHKLVDLSAAGDDVKYFLDLAETVDLVGVQSFDSAPMTVMDEGLQAVLLGEKTLDELMQEVDAAQQEVLASRQ